MTKLLNKFMKNPVIWVVLVLVAFFAFCLLFPNIGFTEDLTHLQVRG